MFKNINFVDYSYYPTLRTRRAELSGLENLSNERKKSILPLLTLGRWPRAENLEASVEQSIKAMGENPFFLDLTYDQDSLSDQIQFLRTSDGGFSRWLKFVEKHNTAIPVIQFGNETKIRDVILQSRSAEKMFGKMAFRIRSYSKDISKVISAVGALDNMDNALIFIDSRYIQPPYSAELTATISTLNLIREEIPGSNISILATSFPTSVGQNKSGEIPIYERQFHSDIGGYPIASYGDYGSIHAVVYDQDTSYMRWSPRIDYPQPYTWEFERRTGFKKAQDGYIDAAKTLLERYPDIAESDIWGEKMIFGAATGGITVGNAPASWIAVRVNIHLTRQIELTKRLISKDDFDDFNDESDEV